MLYMNNKKGMCYADILITSFALLGIIICICFCCYKISTSNEKIGQNFLNKDSKCEIVLKK